MKYSRLTFRSLGIPIATMLTFIFIFPVPDIVFGKVAICGTDIVLWIFTFLNNLPLQFQLTILINASLLSKIDVKNIIKISRTTKVILERVGYVDKK